MITREIVRDVAKATARKHAGPPLTSLATFWERIVTTILEEYEKIREVPMPGTKSIVLDHYTVLRICNALNAEAAAFDVQRQRPDLPKDTKGVLEYSARDNRSLSRNLLEQWEKA